MCLHSGRTLQKLFLFWSVHQSLKTTHTATFKTLLSRHFNLQKIHFYYANWSFNSNCIMSLISILKKDNVCSGFSEIFAQNSFLFATRQFLWETQSPKFENLHFHLQKLHIKTKTTVTPKNSQF